MARMVVKVHFLLAIGVGLLVAQRTPAQDASLLAPAAEWVGRFLVNKLLVDQVWDGLTGKPDVREIERRIRFLESNSVLEGKLQAELRVLRESINDRVTREEFRRNVQKTADKLREIQKQLDDHEVRLVKLEVENKDLKNGTKHSADSQHFLQLSRTYAEQKKFASAIAAASIAIQLKGDEREAILHRCRVYALSGQPAAGIPDATRLIESDKDFKKNIEAYRLRGLGHFQEQNYEAAYKDCSFALDVAQTQARVDKLPEPKDPELSRIVAVSATLKHPHRFLQDNRSPDDEQIHDMYLSFSFAISTDPAYPEAYFRRGSLAAIYITAPAPLLLSNERSKLRFPEGYDRTGKEGLADLDKCLELDPNHALAYLARAWHRIHMKQDFQMALTDVNKAIELNPTDAGDFFLSNAYVARAMANGNLGNSTLYEQDLAKAKEILNELRRQGKIK